MPKFNIAASYPYPVSSVFNAVAQAVQNLPGWTLVEVNQPYWYIGASVSFNFWSYGEKIAIQVTESPPGQSLVNVTSVSNFALIDFGKNRKNIEKLFAAVQNVLAQAGYAGGYQQQAQQSPSAPPAQDVAAVQCPACGAQLAPDARFCTGCGKSMTSTQPAGVTTGPPAQAPAAPDCPACGTKNSEDARFCVGCGQAIHPPAPGSPRQ